MGILSVILGSISLIRQSVKLGLRRIAYPPADAAPTDGRANRTRDFGCCARLRHADFVERCPFSKATRKTFARTKFLPILAPLRHAVPAWRRPLVGVDRSADRKSTRLNS